MADTMTAKRFRVTMTPENNGWWFADAVDVPGAHSQGQTLSRARANIKEAIAAVLDLPRGAEGTMELEERIEFPDPATAAAIEGALRTREHAEAAAADARQALDHALEAIQQAMPGLGVRDQAELLGVSFQRVAQLRPGGPRRGRRTAPTG